MGRRILAITLLIAFASPLVAPLFAATTNPEASLPACCRSHGAHHCAMTHLHRVPPGPAFQAPPCPFYPNPTTAPRLVASLDASQPHAAQIHRDPAPRTSSPRSAPRTLMICANLKRGPPTFPA